MRLIPRTRRRRDPTRSMTVVEHLEELRRRLIISISAVGLGAIVGWIFYGPIFRIVTGPYERICRDLPDKIQPDKCKLIVTGVTEPFFIRFKIAVFAGLAIALPIVLYQLWAFITPGLTQRERRLSFPFVVASLVLFALGGWFAYLTLPKGLRFLLGFTGNELVPLLTVNRYVTFVIFLGLAFGLSFEFPLVLIFLAAAYVITSRQLRDWRRWAWLSISVFAALITPSQDPYTMLAMMVPMLVFYELSILIARLLKR